MPEVKRLRDTNEQMKRELGVEREKVSTSANRWVDWQLHESDNGYYQFTIICNNICSILYYYITDYVHVCIYMNSNMFRYEYIHNEYTCTYMYVVWLYYVCTCIYTMNKHVRICM